MILFYPLLQSINIIKLSCCHMFPIINHHVISVVFGNTIQHFHSLPNIPGYKSPLFSYFSGFFPYFLWFLVFCTCSPSDRGSWSWALSREIAISSHLYFCCPRTVPGEVPVVVSSSTYCYAPHICMFIKQLLIFFSV